MDIEKFTFLNYLFTLLILLSCGVRAQDVCVTPRRQNGQCINIKQCPELIEVLRGPRPLPESSLQFLRDSQCGFEGSFPKVCCAIKKSTVDISVSTTEQPVTVPDPPDLSNHPNLQLLNHIQCGPLSQRRIFGGNRTGVFDFPWMALIAYNTGKATPEFRCGGSIINKRYVLTAAHCVTQLPSGLKLIGVRVGDHDISKERDCDKDLDGLEVVCAERYQDFGIESTIFHPDYKHSKLQDDIALIRVDNDIDFRPRNVKPICLPYAPASVLSQKKVTVTGWGATEYGPRSTVLLKVLLSPVHYQECAQTYKNQVEIWYKQMCAGGTKRMDSCLGDSGGPLQAPGMYNGKLRYIQYGIVSFGLMNCGIEGFPGVYTRVDYYMDWILNNMRD